MLHEASTVEPDAVLAADVCIVGAGAAGITLATELAGTDIAVILLESGGLEREEETHRLNEGENDGLPYARLEASRSRFFGGSTNCWGGWSRPLDARDFATRPWLDESGWPLSAEELGPYYERATALLRLGSPDYGPAILDRIDGRHVSRLETDEEAVRTHVLRFSPPARFGSLYQAELDEARNVRCILHANAVEIETDGDASRARGVRVATLAGGAFRVQARYVVLAAGGIENARLMLLSTAAAPNGVGNDHDLVGRYFMDHPARYLGRLVTKRPQPLDLYDSTFNYHNRAFEMDGAPVAAFLALSDAVQEREEILRHRVLFHTTFPGEDTDGMESLLRLSGRSRFVERSIEPFRDVGQVVRNAPSVATAVVSRCLRIRRLGTPQLIAIVEPEPTPASRVTLGESRDALGLPRARLTWRLTDRVESTFQSLRTLIGDELERIGVGTFEARPPDDRPPNLWCWHHMGTTRMSDHPRQGVVDREGRVHGVPNLYVTGSSVFPTAGCDMPTMTIVALAVRTAELIRAQLESHEAPERTGAGQLRSRRQRRWIGRNRAGDPAQS